MDKQKVIDKAKPALDMLKRLSDPDADVSDIMDTRMVDEDVGPDPALIDHLEQKPVKNGRVDLNKRRRK